ncbi:hypothetical protein GR210_07085 [Rhizobium leguminosarum]|uniref:hypothetical protein n=1 Tax=Rhizobium leguminosarum TaxID=384 RepID=UPI0013DC29A3|nr:hypothetical protein [Rhizobium leguminosarum]MBY5313760.1 hypothetical protein [Rhizobium leguminosarum]NEH48565.1 hypothetical protein [Rhizobium leguminosarum]
MLDRNLYLRRENLVDTTINDRVVGVENLVRLGVIVRLVGFRQRLFRRRIADESGSAPIAFVVIESVDRQKLMVSATTACRAIGETGALFDLLRKSSRSGDRACLIQILLSAAIDGLPALHKIFHFISLEWI